MFTVFECRKCEHRLFVDESGDFAAKLQMVAGSICPSCGEQEEGLWRLLGRAKKFNGQVNAIWEEPGEDYDER